LESILLFFPDALNEREKGAKMRTVYKNVRIRGHEGVSIVQKTCLGLTQGIIDSGARLAPQIDMAYLARAF
jgi:hypothetical protein